MTRWLAGAFERRGHALPDRLLAGVPGCALLAGGGSLRVALADESISVSEPLCLLDGHLDNAAELHVALGLGAGAPVSHEQLLALGWRRWGSALPGRMRGEFALLIWDGQNEVGLLARDQLGGRSLFLHEASGALLFATEVAHLLALLPRRPVPDRVAVAHWLAMSRRPGCGTLFAGIRRLEPGAMLTLDAHGVRETRYWSARFEEPLEEPPERLAELVHSEIERAVARRVSPEGATGVLMSGGLDSCAVAAVASRLTPPQGPEVLACSAVFPDHPLLDETALIEEVRGRLGLPGIVAEVRPGGMLASALAATREAQLPLRSWGDFWALPLMRAAAAGGVRTMLGGDGGDELFGVRAHLLADELRAGHPRAVVRLARELPGAGDRPPTRELLGMLGTVAVAGALPYRLHTLARRPLRAREAPAWLAPASRQDLLGTADPLAWKRLDGPRWWAESAYGLTHGIEQLGLFEHQRQRARMAGLDARAPLLDLDLVQLALRISPRASFDRYRNRPVLRAALAGRLPDSVRLRPGKARFDSLIVDSLEGQDGASIRRLVCDPGAEVAAYVDQAAMQRALFGDPRLRRERPFEWMCLVWRLTSAECWLRLQADPGREVLPGGVFASPARVGVRAA